MAGAAKKILLVEDEPLVLRATADLLDDGGWDVIEARGHAEALDCLDKEPAICALVTDIRLAGGPDGLSLARAVAETRPDIRIVIVSGDVRPEGRDYPPGAIFFTKPYAPGALLEIVEDGEAWARQPAPQSAVAPS